MIIQVTIKSMLRGGNYINICFTCVHGCFIHPRISETLIGHTIIQCLILTFDYFRENIELYQTSMMVER
jgi:hypothetical protein